MKWISALLIVLFVGAASHAQTTTESCPHPSGCVTISREAALKALENADRVKALESEIKVKDAAIIGLKDELANIRIEFARVSGEATALKTTAVRDAAMLELLLKQTRKKCMPFTIFCL